MINTSDLEKAKRLLRAEKSPRIVFAQNDIFNRKILEYGNFEVLLSVEKDHKSKLRQTDSGFNHVLAKIASSKNIALGFDLEEIKSLDKVEKANRLAKILQNIAICRKAKTSIAVKISDIYAAKDFLIGLGASTLQVRDAIVF
jgi:RNase P/RNase MRP subunit p30